MIKVINFTVGLIFGAIAGCIGVSLYTPKSGEALREDLRNSFDEIKLDYELGRQKKQEELKEELKKRWGEE